MKVITLKEAKAKMPEDNSLYGSCIAAVLYGSIQFIVGETYRNSSGEEEKILIDLGDYGITGCSVYLYENKSLITYPNIEELIDDLSETYTFYYFSNTRDLWRHLGVRVSLDKISKCYKIDG